MHRWYRAKCAVFALGVTCAIPLFADSAAELLRAKQAFDEVKQFDAIRVNRLDLESRRAIWLRYYMVLELLGRMEVHQQMIERHDPDRQAQFNAVSAEFNREIDRLRESLREIVD